MVSLPIVASVAGEVLDVLRNASHTGQRPLIRHGDGNAHDSREGARARCLLG